MIDKELGIDTQFLYFIITENNFVKIGMTNNVKKRICQLKRQFPNKYLCCRYAKFAELDDVKLFEKLFHKQFKAFRRFGEWFEFPEFMRFDEMKTIKVHMGEDYNNYLMDIRFLEYKQGDFDG